MQILKERCNIHRLVHVGTSQFLNSYKDLAANVYMTCSVLG